MLTVVMAHARFEPTRRAMLPTVLDSWDCRVRSIVCDDKRSGAWPIVRAGWEDALELSGGEGHLFVAQDDFTIAAGGAELIEALCEQRPADVLSFRWCNEVEVWAAPWVESEDACWLEVGHGWGGGCMAVPAPLVEDFLAWSVDYEDVMRSTPWHHPEFLDQFLRQRDDTRLDLFLLSVGVPVFRCRWSLLEHLGDVSVVRGGVRPPSVEVNLVRDVAGLPPADDPRWVSRDVPSCTAVPEEYRNVVEQLFGGRAHLLGLGHARQVRESFV